jgi:hypothetical protein
MENRLLIVAGKVADEIGIGIPFLMQYNCTWIITHLNLEMMYLPTHGEELVFETWIEQNAHMLSVRNFRIYKKQGEEEQLIGCCKTVWAVLERDKREIVNLFDMPVFKDAVDGEVMKMARAQRMLPLVLKNWKPMRKLFEHKKNHILYSMQIWIITAIAIQPNT